ncbi:MAG: hypothetical protein UY21_C0002G0001 [Microgenomates group bacterium GW2011_GWA1_48_10]|uniref:Uncharacterized protein n=1 Tax=Candidatus Gottesmanbacteria bacterium RIFCSPHIGHO2_01_FULL_47_48 TaxID=1798381 RepID=A0A1F5ZZE6_9BACT|nr:MAG: hypothetical protein UY21_C0002G0001 [Microgenomates group bacterium GW2011_GWA1_48_10]OGG17831.1 MAG: hypothetical protein A2721_02300 [Candidatus Gottesmanbacteria bacterium RIFCSPHIGHO2_01_FULL_47_48]
MNGNTVPASKARTLTAEDLYSELKLMRNQLDKLIDKVLSTMPPKYGSDAWWEEQEQKSREDYAAGKYVTLKDKNDIDKYFAKLHKR